MNPTLYLIGLGLDPVEHATVEALQALGACRKVFFQSLDAEATGYLARFNPGLVALDRDAEPGASVETILGELRAGNSAALATPAHPYLWSPLAALLLERARREGFESRTFGAVSSAGLALAAVGQALGDDILAIQAFDGEAIAEGRAALDPALPAAVYFYRPVNAGTWDAFLRALRASYPPRHPLAWCGDKGLERRTALEDMGEERDAISHRRVLYLDAAEATETRWGRELDARRRTRSRGSGG